MPKITRPVKFLNPLPYSRVNKRRVDSRCVCRRPPNFKGIISMNEDQTKEKLTKIYNELIEALKSNEDKFSQLMLNLDLTSGKFCHDNDKTIHLFLLSLYCNVFWHYYGDKEGQKGEKLKFIPFNLCRNYIVFTYDEKHTLKLLEKLIYFFNTDACNIQPITNSIMNDLQQMKINISA